ncbi:Eco57I restriction-modification methylase domain-containing protein [Streptococcus constellatus]|uniref:Eco57I restriction-modification methylase domain-containing protein n=1 Tax=Streptococcus constellatus TaxID=76860 RepID=UPI002103EE8E|nr:N-6 DNA methylase [Streptococcus constellatus]UTX65150.1 restriction endonuclease [Streptococcus constellatus]
MSKSLQKYYTNSESILNYMVDNLKLSKKDTIFEPSVGEGVFVDRILQDFPSADITTYDIDDYSYQVMTSKYKDKSNIKIIKSDTLLDSSLDLLVRNNSGFSKIIANPPYGAEFNKEQKKLLTEKYKSIYSKDSYVLFLLRCLSLLNEEGRLVFIIPDTFLYLNMHRKFRDILFNNFVVEEISIFPSKWFPGISFAYSRLSIITIRNSKKEILTNKIRIFDSMESDIDFKRLKNGFIEPKIIEQSSVINQRNINIHLNQKADEILNKSNRTLGDVADCVTGIYTGDNRKYLKVKDFNVRNSKNYECISLDEIFTKPVTNEGINDSSFNYIPLIKGSMKTPYTQPEDEWFIKWDKSTIREYHTFKKARFQNSNFYFQTGIATPMLKSKKIKAALMDNRVFDQSIVGVFPKDIGDLYYLLALLNSDIVNEIVHNINPTVNNSANYLKRIPVPDIGMDIKQEIDSLVHGIIYHDEDNQVKLNMIINDIFCEI